jgi:hypothetical protein
MAYARKSNQHELVQLRDEITHEINTDATHLATAVFGETADMPDTSRVSNERLDAIYRRAFERGDRQWLQQEARRDPNQFLQVTERLGVRVPQQQPTAAPAPLPVPAPEGVAAAQSMLDNALGGGPGAAAPPVVSAPSAMPGLPPAVAPVAVPLPTPGGPTAPPLLGP